MLDTRFPRPPGDIGHPAQLRRSGAARGRAGGAWPAKRGRQRASPASKRPARSTFCDARCGAWKREGAKAITTSCGFLVLLQRELQDAVRVPMVTSSLLQLPAAAGRSSRKSAC